MNNIVHFVFIGYYHYYCILKFISMSDKRLAPDINKDNKKAKVQPSIQSFFISKGNVPNPVIIQSDWNDELSHDIAGSTDELTQPLHPAPVTPPQMQDIRTDIVGIPLHIIITSEGAKTHKDRVFRTEWQQQHPWLHHSVVKNVAWCQYCV